MLKILSILLKLKELLNDMSEKEKQKILELEEIHKRISPEFSCSLCKQVLKISTCDGCPIYCQSFSLD